MNQADHPDPFLVFGQPTAIHYRSATDQPYYQEAFGWTPAHAPEATRIGRSTVSLPLSPACSEREIARVLDAVRNVMLHRPLCRQAV
jgi:dTDP-4-amino-4,6-dideoxygalactose transaminase